MKHSQHSKNCLRRGSVSNLGGVVRKPHVPSSMAYILYALFTLLILTRLISPHQILNLYLLPKKKKKQPLGCYHVSHSLSRYICFSPCIASSSFFFCLFFVFLLEFLICKREKMRSYHSLMRGHHSLCSGWYAFYKGTAAMQCYVMLCYAMLCMLNENAGIMGRDY